MTREGNRSLNDVLYESKRKYTTLATYTAGNPIYVGKAKAGTGTDESYWQICKLTWTGGDLTAVKWADGITTFTKKWDDRATYTYS